MVMGFRIGNRSIETGLVDFDARLFVMLLNPMHGRGEGPPIQVGGESRQPLRELGDFLKLRFDDDSARLVGEAASLCDTAVCFFRLFVYLQDRVESGNPACFLLIRSFPEMAELHRYQICAGHDKVDLSL